MSLKIAPNFAFPDEFITSRSALLGRSGSGKSSAAVLLAELMWALGLPWVTIDPKGDWWGMKANKDGTGPGIPVPVFGGLHGDLPLNPHAGTAIAQLVVEKRLTCILDISDFDSRAEQVRFSVDFARALFNAMRRNPGALHLFLEEAEELVPQTPGKEGPEAMMVGLYNKMAKQGRVHGLGVTLLSQRSASVNKNSLSQTGTLILFQTTAPNDQKAVLDWIHDPALKAEVKSTLASLKPGEAWILSPGEFDRSERVQWKRRTTYDSGATPKVGETRAAPTLADIDIAEIEALLADTLTQIEGDDPARLRAEIKRLRAAAQPQLRKIADLEAVIADLRASPVQVPVIPDKLLATLVNVHGSVEERLVDLVDVMGEVLTAVRDVQQESSNVRAFPVPADTESHPAAQQTTLRRLAAVPSPTSAPAPTNGKFGKTQRRVLAAVIPYPDGRTLRQIALLTGYSSKASTIPAAQSELRKLGYGYTENGRFIATPEGIAAMPEVQPLPTGAALLDYWRDRLGKTERAVFESVRNHYPSAPTLDEVCAETGYSPTASTVPAAMSTLRTYELVDGWRLSETFAKASR